MPSCRKLPSITSCFTTGLVSTDKFGTGTSETTKVGYASDDRIIGIILDNYFSGKEQCTEKPVGALFLFS